jgi:hypothetical protein
MGQALKVACATYDANDWWFVMKRINRDWRSCTAVRLQYKELAGSGDIYVALKDADGEIWSASVARNNSDWTELVIPLADFNWRDPWDTIGNGTLDLSNVQEFRFRHWSQRPSAVTFWTDELWVLP